MANHTNATSSGYVLGESALKYFSPELLESKSVKMKSKLSFFQNIARSDTGPRFETIWFFKDDKNYKIISVQQIVYPPSFNICRLGTKGLLLAFETKHSVNYIHKEGSLEEPAKIKYKNDIGIFHEMIFQYDKNSPTVVVRCKKELGEKTEYLLAFDSLEFKSYFDNLPKPGYIKFRRTNK